MVPLNLNLTRDYKEVKHLDNFDLHHILNYFGGVWRHPDCIPCRSWIWPYVDLPTFRGGDVDRHPN